MQSLEDQLQALRQLAEREQILVAEEVVESKSAKDPGQRPEFERLICRIKKGEITALLVWHVNRLSRNMVDGGIIAHLLHSGSLKFIQTPERIYRPEDSALLLAIENGMATSFLQDLSRNVKRGLQGKVSRGWLPGRAPFGYLNDVVSKEIVPDPERFELLRRGWELIATNGYTVAQVQRELVGAGLTGRNGRPVTTSLFYAIFRKQFYTGRFSFQGELHDGLHQPMVSRELFDRVQVALGKAPAVKEHAARHPYAGLFKCSKCGCQITAETKVKTYKTTGVTRSYTYYRCTGYKGCAKASVTEFQLDNVVDRIFSALRVSDSYVEWARKQIMEGERDHVQRLAGDTAALDTQASRIRDRQRRLRDMRLDGEIEASEFVTERARLSEELKTIEGQIERNRQLAERITVGIERKLNLLESVQGHGTLSASAKRALIRSISGECFLTLEKAVFCISEVIYKIATFEPAQLSFRSGESGDLALSVSSWQGLLEDIRTLEESQILMGSGSTVCISVNIASGAWDSSADLPI